MSCIYEEEINVSLGINTASKIIMVIKQLENIRQMPLLIVVRRIIDAFLTRLDIEETSKVLSMLASMKTPNAKKTMASTIQGLVNHLIMKNTNFPQVSLQG